MGGSIETNMVSLWCLVCRCQEPNHAFNPTNLHCAVVGGFMESWVSRFFQACGIARRCVFGRQAGDGESSAITRPYLFTWMEAIAQRSILNRSKLCKMKGSTSVRHLTILLLATKIMPLLSSLLRQKNMSEVEFEYEGYEKSLERSLNRGCPGSTR